MRSRYTKATVASFLIAASSTLAQSAEVNVTVARHQGTGCPSGETPTLWSSGGNRTLTTFPPSFWSETGPGIPTSAGRKFCNVDYLFTSAQPFRLRVLGTSSSSRVKLGAAPQLSYNARLYLANQSPTVIFNRVWLSGDPLVGTWKDPSLNALNQPLVSACGTSATLRGLYTQQLAFSRQNSGNFGEAQALYQLITYEVEDCTL